jgi:AAHS family 4-hydroxybenzoate transporter-like MFS transporter
MTLAYATLSADSANATLRLRVGWLCVIVMALEGFDIAAVGYVVPSLIEAWKTPPAAFTQAFAAGTFGMLAGSLVAGLLGDRIGRKPVLIACVAVFGVFSALSALADSPTRLAMLRFITGLGLGGGVPTMVALTSDFAPSALRGRFVISAQVGFPVGFAVCGFVASALIHNLGWPWVFVVGGLMPIALAPALIRALPESAAFRAPTARRAWVAPLFRDGLAASTVILWALAAVASLTTYFVLLWLPAALHDSGASLAQSVFATTFYSVGLVVGLILMASADRFGMERVLTLGTALGAACLLGIGVFDAPFEPLLALIFGAGLGGAMQGGVNALSGLIYPAHWRATGSGAALGVGRIGSIAGPIFGGLLLTQGYHGRQIFIFAAMSAFGAMALMAALAWVRRSHSGDSQHTGERTEGRT